MTNTTIQTNENFQRLLDALLKLDVEGSVQVDADPLYREFIQRFPAQNIKELSLDDYCVGKGDGRSFCWWLERGLQPLLGRYVPGTARGHILYFQKDGTIYKHRNLRDLSDSEALAYTLCIQAVIAKADMSTDLGWIDDDELLYQHAGVEPRVAVGNGRKLRLLSCYHPNETIPISSSSHLGHFLRTLGCPETEIPNESRPVARMLMLREYLRLASQNGPIVSPVGFMRTLYSSELGFAPVDEDEDDGTNSDEEISIVLTEGAVTNGYISIPKRQSLFPSECIAADETASVELFTLIISDNTEIQTNLLANRGRIKTRFSALFKNEGLKKGDRVRIQKSGLRKYRLIFDRKDQDDEFSEVQRIQRSTRMRNDSLVQTSLNQILYGPPGTGKTYHTAFEAVRICMGDGAVNEVKHDRSKIMEMYRNLVALNRIEFVTFHQSLSYEEFVEGLRPDTSQNSSDTLPGEVTPSAGFSLKPHEGLFQRISERARLDPGHASEMPPRLDRNRTIYCLSFTGAAARPKVQKALDLNRIDWSYGGDKDWSASDFDEWSAIKAERQKVMPDINGNSPEVYGTWVIRSGAEIGDLVVLTIDTRRIAAVGRITGPYTYVGATSSETSRHSRSVDWIWSDPDGVDRSRFYPKAFTSRHPIYMLENDLIGWDALEEMVFGEEAMRPTLSARPYVLIIDEINRANISKVFGELITLLEPDKRLGMQNEIRLKLPYSKKPFGVPANLHIIGTMNTADRSIALLDTALRRRFTFRELLPDPSVLSANVDGINLRRLLTILNERIEYLFDREHQIGHAYFTACRTRADIDNTMRHKIIPLLAEYFYEDWSRVAAVLGDAAHGKSCFLTARVLPAPDSVRDDDMPQQRLRWIVNPDFDFSDFTT